MWQLSRNKLVWRQSSLFLQESLEETNISNEEMFNDYDEDSDNNIYEKDESDNDLKIIQNTLLFLTMLRIFSVAVYQIFYYDWVIL